MTRARRRRPKPRVLIDTNVWRYIADAAALDEVRQSAFENKVQVQVAPSTLYEALRTRDPALRARLSMVMTHQAWARLMPEVRDEAYEFLSEVRR
jgi:predicted nucleic acid-binding protein